MPTLLELRTEVRSKIDRVNAATPTNTEINGWINESAAELWDEVVTVYEDQFTTYGNTQTPQSTPIDIENLSDLFGLLVPSGHDPVRLFKLRALEYSVNGEWREVDGVPRQEWRKYETATGSPHPVGYTLLGTDIHLLPSTTASQTYRLTYIPTYDKMVEDADEMFYVPNRWDEFVVVDACIKARIKLQQDPSAEMARKAELRQRIRRAASNRTPGQSHKVTERATHRGRN
jgi:hypothetical protein